jgi:hypothetical protein
MSRTKNFAMNLTVFVVSLATGRWRAAKFSLGGLRRSVGSHYHPGHA